MRRLLALCLALAAAMPAAAQDRLGYGRLFVNDTLGDFRDRWQTGSIIVSELRGRGWDGAPGAFGTLWELRLRAGVISPENLETPSPADRRYASTVALGLHTHFALGRAEARLGADLVVLGPQTGLDAVQTELHEIIGLPRPDTSAQIGDDVIPTLSAEIGREVALGRARLRPFVEAQAGVETLLRAGADLTLGDFGTGALMLRDPVTGHRYPGIAGSHRRGVTVLLGADVARVFDSAYFPAGGPAAKDIRTRLRAGINWRRERAEVFWGVAWLSPEFDGQSSGQTVGAARVTLRF